MQKMQNRKLFISRGAKLPNMQVLKFCLPKESISEQLDSGYIDTGQKKESKISSNYYLRVLVYIVNDEIQYYST